MFRLGGDIARGWPGPRRLLRQDWVAVRVVFLVCGFLLLGLGIVGYITPGLPGTIFVILAAGCFAKSSPRFEKWILEHPKFGPPVRAWRLNKSMPIKAKWMATGGMTFGAISIGLVPMKPAIKISLWAVELMCMLYVWSRPTTPAQAPSHDPANLPS